MTIEYHVHFVRRPDPVTALRLHPQGIIPIQHADQPWIKDALARGQLTVGPMGGFFVSAGTSTRAAYGGEWIVRHQLDGRMEVLTDSEFQLLYMPAPEEGEDE